jgi:hypothetical protein
VVPFGSYGGVPPTTHPRLSTLLYISVGTNPRLQRDVFTLGCHGESKVIGKQYFVRQAAILFKFAKATKDPKVSAALLDKAADLKQQVDEPGAQRDLSPLAPDIEPPPAT